MRKVYALFINEFKYADEDFRIGYRSDNFIKIFENKEDAIITGINIEYDINFTEDSFADDIIAYAEKKANCSQLGYKWLFDDKYEEMIKQFNDIINFHENNYWKNFAKYIKMWCQLQKNGFMKGLEWDENDWYKATSAILSEKIKDEDDEYVLNKFIQFRVEEVEIISKSEIKPNM